MKNKKKRVKSKVDKKPLNYKMIGAILILSVLIFLKLSPVALNKTLNVIFTKDCDYTLMIEDIKKTVRFYTLGQRVFNLPVNDVITSPFGERIDPVTNTPAMHLGIDINAPLNTEVFASEEGVVTRVEENEYYGKFIMIDHGRNFATLYGHLSLQKVKCGDRVDKDTVIALSGSSGKSTGPHLHFEIRKEGEHQNPEDYLK